MSFKKAIVAFLLTLFLVPIAGAQKDDSAVDPKALESFREMSQYLKGRRWSAGEIETNYRGDFGYATVGGPGGRRTAMAGPYGGAVVTRFPSGYRTVNHFNRPYYYHGGHYYRPYHWGGYPYSFPCPPPYGVYYNDCPVGAITLAILGTTYYVAENIYYEKTYNEGKVAYKVVPAPQGATLTVIPDTSARVTVGTTTYYYHANTFHRKSMESGKTTYVVVSRPKGVVSLDALPADFEIVTAGGSSYFAHQGVYHLPYLDENGSELYIRVDPPPGQAQAETASDGYATVERDISLPAGTLIAVRTAQALDSGSAQAGETFTGYMDNDVYSGNMLVVSRGTTVHGRVVDARKAGKMKGKASLTLELSAMVTQSRTTRITSSQLKIDGKKAKTLKQIGGAAAMGAIIGGIADGGEGAAIGAAVGTGAGTAVAASTKGKQVRIESQMLLQFRLESPVSVPITVRVAEK